jgi:ribosomal protein S18
LIALKENNIPIDSSMFYGHKNCKVNWSKNRIVEKNGIIEVPITIFRRNRYINLRLCNIKKGSQYVKTDIDWANLEELKFFVQEAKKNNVRVMNLFMHSYSFVKFDKNFTRFEPDYKDIEKFEKFLRFISKDEAIRVITLKEFYKMYRQESAEFLGSDHVPVVDYVERFNPIKNSVSAGKSIIRKLVKSA